ncbi:calcineurin-like phosphoesterase family protein, partial [Mariniflexile fucanivorans]
MKQIIKLLPCFVILFIVQSCATYDMQIKVVSQTKQDTSGINIFLIGDAGKLENNQPSKALIALNDKIKDSKKEDLLLFLGDNIYPNGLSDSYTEEAKLALQSQIDVAKNFNGRVIFLPGNHDWYSGIDGLKEEAKLVGKALGDKSFSPQDACPLDSYDVSNEIVVITVDSEWYITNWDKHPKMNDNCNIKYREKFISEFKSLVNKNQDKTIILAMHHPLGSYGSHGGQFLFNPLKAPLNVLRNASGISPADLNHPLYRELSNKITTILQEYKNDVIVVSGHDHNLQYLVHKNIPQIISGSGSKVKPVRHYEKDASSFGYAGLGFAVLNIQENNQTVQYYDETNQLIHSKVIREIQTEKPLSVSNFPKESIISKSIYTKHTDDKSKNYNSFFGNHYRQLYYNKFDFPVVNLDTLHGGLKPVKLGGGNQSVSLRLEDNDGKEYVMRRMRKSATQFIQVKAFQEEFMKERLENTVADRFIMDFYTTSYPFAA